MSVENYLEGMEEEKRKFILSAITFENFETKVINPARFDVMQLSNIPSQGDQKTTQSKYLSIAGTTTPALCTITGSVKFSKLFNPPPLTNTKTEKSILKKVITINPIPQEFERYIACIGKALGINHFDFALYQGGVSIGTMTEQSGMSRFMGKDEPQQPNGRKPVVMSNVRSGFMKSGSTSGMWIRPFSDTVPVADLSNNLAFNFGSDFDEFKGRTDMNDAPVNAMVMVLHTVNAWRGKEGFNPWSISLNVISVLVLP
ncbi:hypothetical protein BD410DRAFT_847121 [Rickenella mellea]|uniref:Uncharacterized protein n=1 Tax=Rickenella mellea TaxID=50990 RepID=A0A4Y7PDI0_9AGAM|nr:hypothetical protein BD410DRAFT_847121 [Rickenella mellea]